ncbi:MAG: hypothetical protein U0Q15_03705 [Kineosporiaceae bacterium]
MDDCRHCGRGLPLAAAFCPDCGTPVPTPVTLPPGPASSAQGYGVAAGSEARTEVLAPPAATVVLPAGYPTGAPGDHSARAAAGADSTGTTEGDPAGGTNGTTSVGTTDHQRGVRGRAGAEEPPHRRRVPLAVLALLALLVIGLVSGITALSAPDHRTRPPAAAPVPSPSSTASATEPASPDPTPPSASPTPTTSSPSPTTTSPRPTTSSPVPTTSAPAPPGAAQQVAAMDALLGTAAAAKDGLGKAIGRLQGQCAGKGDYGQGVSGLNEAIAARASLLGALNGLDVSAVPQGGQLKDALRRGWQASLDADRAFLRAAETAGAGRCPVQTPPWREGLELSKRARDAKAEFARTWNREIAGPYQLQRRTEARL